MHGRGRMAMDPLIPMYNAETERLVWRYRSPCAYARTNAGNITSKTTRHVTNNQLLLSLLESRDNDQTRWILFALSSTDSVSAKQYSTGRMIYLTDLVRRHELQLVIRT